ncbi:MAG: hypothetical protein MMC33_001067 [Icmadophila ericetorum]|nr:hypothetical protein [Icmadophila ericetorum]
MAYSGGEGSEDAGLGYLKRSIQFELKRRLSSKAKLVIEGEDGFQHVNARYSDYKRPWYIAGVRVANEADAIETVNYARLRNIPFVARTGGHSLTTSLRRIQNAIVIDMRGLNTIKYDASKQQMTIGGGITTGEFANATFSKGMEVSKCLPIV